MYISGFGIVSSFTSKSYKAPQIKIKCSITVAYWSGAVISTYISVYMKH